MVAERREITTILTVDARDLEAKAAAVAANIDKVGASLLKLSGAPAAVEQKLDASAKATRRQASELENLLRQMDPVYAAHAKLASEQERLQRGLQGLDAQYRSSGRSAESASSAASMLTEKSKALVTIQDELSRGLIGGAEASRRIAEAMSSQAGAADAAARAQAAAAASLDQVRRSYDPVYAAIRRHGEEMTRVDGILKAANVSEAERTRILSSVTAAYDPATRAANERAAALQKEREAQAALMAGYREQASLASSSMRGQAMWNSYAGVQSGPSVSAAASASVFEEAAAVNKATMARSLRRDAIEAETRALDQQMKVDAAEAARKEAAALQSLRDKLDPASKATRDLAENQAILGKALAAKDISPEQYEKLTKALLDGGAAAGVSAGQMQQARRIVTSNLINIGNVAIATKGDLASMVSPIPDVIYGFSLMGKEGAGTAGTLAIVGGAVLTVAAAAGVAMIAQAKYAESVREVERVNRLFAGTSGLTTDAFVAQSDASAKAAGISKSSAREIQTAYAATGKIGGDMLGLLTSATKNWAAATGQDMDKARDELAGLFSDPAKGASELTQKYGLLSDAELQHIKNLQAQGEREAAQKSLLDAVADRTQNAAERISGIAKAWEAAKKAGSDFFNWAGSFGESGQTEDQRLAAMQKDAAIWRARVAANPNGTTIVDGARVRDADMLREADAKTAQFLFAIGENLSAAAKDKATAAFRELQSSVMDFARSVDPALNATTNLTNAEKLLDKAEAEGAVTLNEKRRLLGLYREQVDVAAGAIAQLQRQAANFNAPVGFERKFASAIDQATDGGKRPITGDQANNLRSGLVDVARGEAGDQAAQIERQATAQRLLAGSLSVSAKAAAENRIALAEMAVQYPDLGAGTATAILTSKDFSKTLKTLPPELQNVFAAMESNSANKLAGDVALAAYQMRLQIGDASRLADAQAKGGDLAMAQARSENVYASEVAKGTSAVQALTLAMLDYQKSLIDLDGQQRAWNRDLAEQIRTASELARAEGVSGAAVGEANVQARIRAQILKEGVPLESERAQAIDAGTRALEAQNAAAKVNSSIRGQNQDLTLAKAEYDLLGSTNAEREKQMGILRATLEMQNDPAWSQMPKELQDAWAKQAGAVAEYRSRLDDAKAAGADFANSITKGLEDIILAGGKVGDVFKELVKSVERGVLRETITKPLNEMLTGSITKMLAPTPANNNLIQPVTASDPGGYLSKFLASTSGAGVLGTQSTPMTVQFAQGVGFSLPQMASGQPMPVAVSNINEFDSMFAAAGAKYGIDPTLLKAIAQAESSLNPSAVNRSSGATGLMQIMPANAAYLNGSSATDPAANIDAGAKILREHLERAGGDMDKALSTYSGHVKTSGANYVAAVYGNQQAIQAQTAATTAQASATQALTSEQQSSIDASMRFIQDAGATTTDAAGEIEKKLGDFSDGAKTSAERLAASQATASAASVDLAQSANVAGQRMVSGFGQAVYTMLAMLSGASGGGGAAAAAAVSGQANRGVAGTVGVGLQAMSAGKSAYTAFTGGYAKMGVDAGNWLAISKLGQGLGLSSMPDVATTTAGAAFNPAPALAEHAGGFGASSGAAGLGAPTVTPAGEAFAGTLGQMGAGLPFGAVGGFGGGLIGTATNSKAIGGLSGAALGAGSAAAYEAIFGAGAAGGPVGMAVAAVVAAVIAVLGTTKKSSNYAGAYTAMDDNWQITDRKAGGETAEGTKAIQQANDGIQKIIASFASAGGMTLTGGSLLVGTQTENGKVSTRIGGWDGQVVSTSEDPTQIAKDVLGYLRGAGRLQIDDPLVGRAYGQLKDASAETMVQVVTLAHGVTEGRSALQEMDKSLHTVQVSALEASAKAFAPMVEQLDLATKYGFKDEYVGLVKGQLSNMLDDMANPTRWTQVQADLATLDGQAAAFRQAVEKIDPAMVAMVDRAKELAKERIVSGVRKNFDASMNSAQGNDFLNQLTGVRDYWNANAADMVLAGRDPNALYAQQASQTFAGLSVDQLDTVVRYFEKLDPVMSALAATAREGKLGTALQDLDMRMMQAQVSLGTVSQEQAAANSLALTQARELAGVTNTTVRARLMEVQAAEKQAAAYTKLAASSKTLTDWINGKDLGSLSSLSAPEQFAAAQRQFGTALAGSDASAATQAANNLLTAGRSVYGTTSAYAALDTMTTSSLTQWGQRLGLPGFAVGTDSAPSGWAMVGEQGAELVRFRGGEQVYTAPQTRTMLGGGSDNKEVVARLERQNEILAEQNRLLTALLRGQAEAAEHVADTVSEVGDRQEKALVKSQIFALSAGNQGKAA